MTSTCNESSGMPVENTNSAKLHKSDKPNYVMIRIENISPNVLKGHIEALVLKAMHHFKDTDESDSKANNSNNSNNNTNTVVPCRGYNIRMPQPVLWMTFPVGRVEILMGTLEDTVSVYAMLNGCILDGSRLKLSLVRIDPHRTDADIARDEAQKKADIICGVGAVGRRAPPENISITERRKYDDGYRMPMKRERSTDPHYSRHGNYRSSLSYRRREERRHSVGSYGRHRRSMSPGSSQRSSSYTQRSSSYSPSYRSSMTPSSDSQGHRRPSGSSYSSHRSSSSTTSISERSYSSRISSKSN